MSDVTKKLTIIIPTMNRPDFIGRQLQYYANCGFGGLILLADSSDNSCEEQNKAHIKSVQSNLLVEHRHVEAKGVNMAVGAMSPYIPTKYVVLIGDDDFLIPSAFQSCIEFLDSHLDYSAVHGVALAIRLGEKGAYGGIVWAGYYDLGEPDVCGSFAGDRLKEYLKNYSTSLFSIHRTPQWQEMWQAACTIPDQTFGSELLPSCLSAVFGKIKLLDMLYLIRQDHLERYWGASKYQWMANPGWGSWYSRFVQALARYISDIDVISDIKALQVAEESFDLYMVSCLGPYWADYTTIAKKHRFYLARQVLRRVPGVLQSLNRLHSRNIIHEDGSILPELLSLTSPFYYEFIKIADHCSGMSGMKRCWRGECMGENGIDWLKMHELRTK